MNRIALAVVAIAATVTAAAAQGEAPPAPPPAAPTEALPAAEAEPPPRQPELPMPPPPPACDAAAVEADRGALDRERRSARRWNTAWAISYAGLAGIQAGMAVAEISLGGDFDDAARASLYIGAGKAVIGSLSRIVLPLRVPHVARSGDACVDQAALARAHAYAARKERNSFWLQLGGGAALHLIGGGYLVVYEDSWKQAITSLALGAVVATVNLYTQPKTSWRSPRATVVPMPARDGMGVALVGAF